MAKFVESGLEPYFFVHCPNDGHAPELARRFHDALRTRLDVGDLPRFAGEKARQIDLF